MELKLKGKTALVTGGSKGIGLAIKKALEKEGVKVTSWSRSEGFDLMKPWRYQMIMEKFPKVDILINNVGGIGSNPYEERLAMEKNYGVMADLTREFLKDKARWGRVITISSIYGKEKGPNPGFVAAKSAQIAYMKSLSGTYEGVTFNTICPGHIDVGKRYKIIPKIFGKPEDVANIVVFLCSNKAKHINGACITVDGGESHAF